MLFGPADAASNGMLQQAENQKNADAASTRDVSTDRRKKTQKKESMSQAAAFSMQQKEKPTRRCRKQSHMLPSETRFSLRCTLVLGPSGPDRTGTTSIFRGSRNEFWNDFHFFGTSLARLALGRTLVRTLSHFRCVFMLFGPADAASNEMLQQAENQKKRRCRKHSRCFDRQQKKLK